MTTADINPEEIHDYPLATVPKEDHFKQKYRDFYQKYKYYKDKHIVFRALGYRCEICGLADPDRLMLHHDDENTWTHLGGRDRFVKARELIRNGGDTSKIELNCNKCHDLRDGGLSKEQIIGYMAEGYSHKEIAEEENIVIKNGHRRL